MASSLGNRVGSVRNCPSLRFPLNFMRALSTSSSTFSTSSSISSAQSPKKSKRRKKKNLFEVAQFLPNWGIGCHMAKSHWNEVSYEITKLNLYKDGRHGKAWGIAHKNGCSVKHNVPKIKCLPLADAPKKISGVHKRCWKYLSDVVKTSDSSTNLTNPTDSGLKLETEAS
ncbi:uncharacterized protein LOC106780527 isoform X1 [Vigna radiata var. radiata]|uniref:Uncharacterized protein LOC106780527 isoform X1 n=1 Tax=Vigna radiata var. radiata TaxID=3916 RepID=A0A3Q0ENU6_VIGRR|nr:uncharacterized protein LOC106780527 isoform X1 [Vigna radiata var. radiata]